MVSREKSLFFFLISNSEYPNRIESFPTARNKIGIFSNYPRIFRRDRKMTFHVKISFELKYNFARSFRSEISIKVLHRDLQMHKIV